MPRRTSILGAVAAALALTVVHVAPGSPSGERWIVFAAHPDGLAVSQLFRVRTTGEGLEQITTGTQPASAPSFSPDGTHIVFSRLGSGIFRVNLDGTGLRRLSSNIRDSQPVWSPDGKRIAYLRPYEAQWRVYVMSESGGGKRRLPQAPPAGRPSWAPGSKAILIPSGGDVVRIDAETGKVQTYYGMTIDIQISQNATASPDGRLLAYVGPRLSTGPPDCGEGRCPQFGLYLAGIPKPHRPRRIVNDTGPAGWSPDGKSLVFVAKGVLTLRTLSGGTPTTIATEPHVAAAESAPAWQPR